MHDDKPAPREPAHPPAKLFPAYWFLGLTLNFMAPQGLKPGAGTLGVWLMGCGHETTAVPLLQ